MCIRTPTNAAAAIKPMGWLSCICTMHTYICAYVHLQMQLPPSSRWDGSAAYAQCIRTYVHTYTYKCSCRHQADGMAQLHMHNAYVHMCIRTHTNAAAAIKPMGWLSCICTMHTYICAYVHIQMQLPPSSRWDGSAAYAQCI